MCAWQADLAAIFYLGGTIIQGMLVMNYPDYKFVVIEYGTGQFAPDTSDIELATTPADKWLCQNLIVRGTSFQSFSILALTLTG